MYSYLVKRCVGILLNFILGDIIWFRVKGAPLHSQPASPWGLTGYEWRGVFWSCYFSKYFRQKSKIEIRYFLVDPKLINHRWLKPFFSVFHCRVYNFRRKMRRVWRQNSRVVSEWGSLAGGSWLWCRRWNPLLWATFCFCGAEFTILGAKYFMFEFKTHGSQLNASILQTDFDYGAGKWSFPPLRFRIQK